MSRTAPFLVSPDLRRRATGSVAVALVVLLGSPMPAASEPAVTRPDQGRAVGEQIAAAIDADRDGLIAKVELRAFSARVFASIDVDADGSLTLPELRGWREGLLDLAVFRGRTEAFETGTAILFDLFDRNADGRVDAAEHDRLVTRSALEADMDSDGRLTRREFLDRFVVSIAMRNALEAS